MVGWRQANPSPTQASGRGPGLRADWFLLEAVSEELLGPPGPARASPTPSGTPSPNAMLARLSPQLGSVYTEGGFVEGVNKKLGLFGDYVDIFKGIPFAAPPKTLENPQRHPGWQGGSGGRWAALAAGLASTDCCPHSGPVATCRDPEGHGLQEAMPADHHHPGQHPRGRRLPLPQHLGPPGQEGRSVCPPMPPSSPRLAKGPSFAPRSSLGPQS